MMRSSLFLILALAVQQSVARLTPTRVDEEFGRHAKVDAFMKFEAAEEDKLFFDRALAGHIMMSMSMSMSMPMAMEAEGATGTASGIISQEDAKVEVALSESTPKEGIPTTAALEPVNTLTLADSSASKAALGVSCLVGAVGMLVL